MLGACLQPPRKGVGPVRWRRVRGAQAVAVEAGGSPGESQLKGPVHSRLLPDIKGSVPQEFWLKTCFSRHTDSYYFMDHTTMFWSTTLLLSNTYTQTGTIQRTLAPQCREWMLHEGRDAMGTTEPVFTAGPRSHRI